MVEMARDCMFLFFYTSENPKFLSIADVIYYGIVRSASKKLGKRWQLLTNQQLLRYCQYICIGLHVRDLSG